jgi:type I restriction enzyme M protein
MANPYTKKVFLKANDSAIYSWCEDNDFNLNAKAKTKLLDTKMWLQFRGLVSSAHKLMVAMEESGNGEISNDFNKFKDHVDVVLKKLIKTHDISLGASEKNAILKAVSWYDESAVRVVKKKVKFKQDKLDELLHHLGCEESELLHFGYFPTGNKNEFITYETNSDLRDAESIPLTYNKSSDSVRSDIHQYFLDEVKPHVHVAWINLNSTKIGYEISFNKYFYQHKLLRSMEDVAIDIINLEQKAEGLIADILGIDITEVQGE